MIKWLSQIGLYDVIKGTSSVYRICLSLLLLFEGIDTCKARDMSWSKEVQFMSIASIQTLDMKILTSCAKQLH